MGYCQGVIFLIKKFIENLTTIEEKKVRGSKIQEEGGYLKKKLIFCKEIDMQTRRFNKFLFTENLILLLIFIDNFIIVKHHNCLQQIAQNVIHKDNNYTSPSSLARWGN